MSCFTEEQLSKISNLVREIEKLSDIEKLLLYLRLPCGRAELNEGKYNKPSNGRHNNNNNNNNNEASLFSKKPDQETTQTYTWILSHLEEDASVSLPKQEVYDEYRAFCQANRFEPLCVADFGKAMKHAFPCIKPRRLGQRGNSRYCYSGLRKKYKIQPPSLPQLGPESNHLSSPLIPDCCSIGDTNTTANATMAGCRVGQAAFSEFQGQPAPNQRPQSMQAEPSSSVINNHHRQQPTSTSTNPNSSSNEGANHHANPGYTGRYEAMNLKVDPDQEQQHRALDHSQQQQQHQQQHQHHHHHNHNHNHQLEHQQHHPNHLQRQHSHRTGSQQSMALDDYGAHLQHQSEHHASNNAAPITQVPGQPVTAAPAAAASIDGGHQAQPALAQQQHVPVDTYGHTSSPHLQRQEYDYPDIIQRFGTPDDDDYRHHYHDLNRPIVSEVIPFSQTGQYQPSTGGFIYGNGAMHHLQAAGHQPQQPQQAVDAQHHQQMPTAHLPAISSKPHPASRLHLGLVGQPVVADQSASSESIPLGQGLNQSSTTNERVTEATSNNGRQLNHSEHQFITENDHVNHPQHVQLSGNINNNIEYCASPFQSPASTPYPIMGNFMMQDVQDYYPTECLRYPTQ